jgi:hypothetical protein
VLKGALNSFPLGVNHGFFWCDDNLRFHYKNARQRRT